ncbi:MAG: hypothetical protein FJ293_13900, partial [Planctomycetes bacterium]|nr:hypothetical protein [Planctomycetota bacterium]
MSLPLAVAWPVFVVAFGAAAALAACAWVGAIALLARSDGDAELRSAAARWREDAHADWRGRTRSMVVLVLALGVVGLVAASGASARVAWCAALIGSGAVLLAEWMALRMAGALVPRMAAAATGGATEAAAVAARGE